jgi:thymidine kinase
MCENLYEIENQVDVMEYNCICIDEIRFYNDAVIYC